MSIYKNENDTPIEYTRLIQILTLPFVLILLVIAAMAESEDY